MVLPQQHRQQCRLQPPQQRLSDPQVYFPREILPLGSLLTGLLDLTVYLLLLLLLILIPRLPLGPPALLTPALIVILAAPLFAGAALWASRGAHFRALLLLRDSVLLTAICFGAVEPVMRYFHPFSFSVLAALAILAETALRRRPLLSLRPPLGRGTDR